MYEQIMKYAANLPAMFAGILIAAVPCFVLFLIFQNTLMQTVHFGGLKG